MTVQYEYEVWMVQEDRVTFVNGRWRGEGNPIVMTGNQLATALKTCPLLWDLLNERGKQGWELITIVPLNVGEANASKAYVKRCCTV